MSRILKSLGVVAAVAAALPVLSGAAPARVAANSTTYQDSTGEDAQGPDITTVIVSNDNTGLITFQINIPSQASLSGVKITDIEIDADSSPTTGSTDAIDLGADYAIELFQDQVTLFKWDGQTFSRTASGPSQATLVFSNAPTGPIIKINASELGDTKKLGFSVLTASGITTDAAGNLDFTNAHADLAPDLGHGFYSYVVKTEKLRLVSKQFRTVPSRPRAGGLFSAQLVAARNDTGAVLASGAVKCTAKVGGASIAARAHKISNGVAKCSWLIPGSARGKTLRGTITVVFEGLKVSRSFALPVG